MAIKPLDNYYIFSYNEYLKEMSLSDEEIVKHDTFLKDVSKTKENIETIRKVIDKLRISLSNTDEFSLKKVDSNNSIDSYHVFYTHGTSNLVHTLERCFLDDISGKLKQLYFKTIYPDKEERPFEVIVQISKIFNRIHVPVGLPLVIQGVGFGKKIYRAAIKKFKYISTNRMDRTMDAVAVWDSLRKDHDIFSFIIEDKMICFDDKVEYSEIEKVLLEFFKHEIEEEKLGNKLDTYAVDTDFREKYRMQMLKSDLKYILR